MSTADDTDVLASEPGVSSGSAPQASPEEAGRPAPEAGEPTRRLGKASRAAEVGWRAYQQIAAVIGAFGILALIGHFWDIGLKGFIATIVGVWDATIRPAVEFVCHVLVTTPLSWFGVEFEVPLWLRDHVSVGAILALSITRDYRIRRARRQKSFASYLGRPILSFISALLLGPILLPLWPMAVATSVYGTEWVRISKRAFSSAAGLALLAIISCTIAAFSMPSVLDRFLMTATAIGLFGSLAIMMGVMAGRPLLIVLIGATKYQDPELREAAGSLVSVLSPLLYLAILLLINLFL